MKTYVFIIIGYFILAFIFKNNYALSNSSLLVLFIGLVISFFASILISYIRFNKNKT